MEVPLLDLDLFMEQCDMEFCPPPIFDLPPPPPPSWMETGQDCRETGGCHNAPIISSLDNVQEIFHSISIIVVSSLIIVISLMFGAVLVWRRRQFLLRKFGSNPEITGESDLSNEKTRKPEFGHRTLPNHYISDHQLIADLNGRTILPGSGTIQHTSTPSSPPSTLIIGGVPFHLLEHPKPEGVVRYEGGEYPGSQRSIYPVYETIESDYSELSSVYSDRDLSGLSRNFSGRSGGMSGTYHDMSGAQYLVSGLNTISARPDTLNGTGLRESVLQFGQSGQLGQEVSGYPFSSQNQINQNSFSGPQHQQLASRPDLRINRTLLRNLPARRTQSFKSHPPLPPLPRIQFLQSTISLECPPASSPVTQL